jgi:hypothetical protein
MFAAKARPYLSEAPWVSSLPYPQTLDKAGKACQGQTLELIMNICKLQPQFFCNFGPELILLVHKNGYIHEIKGS